MDSYALDDLIYLDHQATTPVDPRVLDAMLPFLSHAYGNASSVQHARGQRVADAIEQSREQVAALLGADPREIVFTSGATESNNLAILGLASACEEPGHIVSCATEHPAVLEPLRSLKSAGWHATYLGVDGRGEIDLDDLAHSLLEDTQLVSIMTASNEIGNAHPLDKIVAIAGERGIPVHSDAAQAAGKLPIDTEDSGVALLSLSGHKLYGPQGVGALYVRRVGGPTLHPLLHGGGHERGLRSGTLNAPGIVGLGAACEIAQRELADEGKRLARQRDLLRDLLLEGCPQAIVNGPGENRRVPGSLHISFPGTDSDAVMASCPGVAMASGSACASGTPGPSHVLRAMGMPEYVADGSLRLSVGRFTTDEEVAVAAARVLEAVTRVRDRIESASSSAAAIL